MHGDLHISNVMIKGKEAKVGDLGWSRIESDTTG
jgi:aminoglycoside phosphotransferase (APT) family kinase protein